MFCKNCGAPVKTGSSFCGECGRRIETEPVTPPVKSTPFHRAGDLNGSSMGTPVQMEVPAEPQLRFSASFNRPPMTAAPEAPVAETEAATALPDSCGDPGEADTAFCNCQVSAPAAEPVPAPETEKPKFAAVVRTVPPPRTEPAPEYCAPVYAAPPAANPYAAAPVAQLKTNKRLWKFLLFGLLTFGIYNIVVLSSVSNNINIVASRYDGKRTMHYCLLYFLVSWLTLGIADIVWYHKISNRIGDELARRGVDYSFGAGRFWIFRILLGFVIIGPLIYYHKLFKATNKICEHYNRFG